MLYYCILHCSMVTSIVCYSMLYYSMHVDSDPGTSESATRYYANEILTHDGDQSSSSVTESTAEINPDADFYKQVYLYSYSITTSIVIVIVIVNHSTSIPV